VIQDGYVIVAGDYVRFLFLTYYLLAVIITLNLVVALILDAFVDEMKQVKAGHGGIGNKQYDEEDEEEDKAGQVSKNDPNSPKDEMKTPDSIPRMMELTTSAKADLQKAPAAGAASTVAPSAASDGQKT